MLGDSKLLITLQNKQQLFVALIIVSFLFHFDSQIVNHSLDHIWILYYKVLESFRAYLILN